MAFVQSPQAPVVLPGSMLQVPLQQFDPDRHYRTTGQFLDTEPGP